MADPLPALLAEQERLRPMLERLLTLAARWADPPAQGGAPAPDVGEPAEAALGRLRFSEAPIDPVAALGTPTVVVADGGPGGGAADRPAAPATPATEPVLTSATRITDAVPLARARAVPAGSPSSPEHSRPPPSRAVILPPTALPSVSLARLRDRVAGRPDVAERTIRHPVLVPAPRVAPASSGVLAAASLAAAALPDPAAPVAGGIATGHVGTADRATADPGTADRGIAAWAAATGGMAGSRAGLGNEFGDAVAASAAGDPAGLPGDALEERLADLLERAAIEAGISLP